MTVPGVGSSEPTRSGFAAGMRKASAAQKRFQGSRPKTWALLGAGGESLKKSSVDVIARAATLAAYNEVYAGWLATQTVHVDLATFAVPAAATVVGTLLTKGPENLRAIGKGKVEQERTRNAEKLLTELTEARDAAYHLIATQGQQIDQLTGAVAELIASSSRQQLVIDGLVARAVGQPTSPAAVSPQRSAAPPDPYLVQLDPGITARTYRINERARQAAQEARRRNVRSGPEPPDQGNPPPPRPSPRPQSPHP